MDAAFSNILVILKTTGYSVFYYICQMTRHVSRRQGYQDRKLLNENIDKKYDT